MSHSLTANRYFIGYGCSFIPGKTASFRTAWGIQYVPCVLFMLGLPFLPRSPRWLAKVDRSEEAIHVLANIQAGGNLEDPYVIAEYEEIVTVLTAERQAPAGWRKFVVNGMWKRTLAGFSCQAWQQLSGANVMTYYVVYIFYMAGLQGNVNLISSGVQYALFIIFSTIMFFFVDKIGRRTLLVYGAIAMSVCHFVVGGTLGAHYTLVPGRLYRPTYFQPVPLTVRRRCCGQCQCCHQGVGSSCPHSHRLLLSAHHRLCTYARTYLLGVCCRGMVA